MAVPFFLVAFPLIILFLEGFAYREMYGADLAKTIATVRQVVMSVAAIGIVTVGICVLPQTIIEFKHSVLLKRIGASGTKIKSFVVTIIIMIFTFFWTIMWGGIMFGPKYGWNNIIGFKYAGMGFIYMVLLIATAIMFGIMIALLLKSVSASAFITISNIIYIPVAFLSGTFIPMSLIEKSDVLNILSYFNIYKYTIAPLSDCWMGSLHYNTELLVYSLVAVGLIGVYT